MLGWFWEGVCPDSRVPGTDDALRVELYNMSCSPGDGVTETVDVDEPLRREYAVASLPTLPYSPLGRGAISKP